jgi:hypothetical protein
MTHPQKAGGRDTIWLAIGWLVLLALLFFPVAAVIEVISDTLNQEGEAAGWGSIIAIALWVEVGIAGLIGFLARALGNAARRPRLGMKWFLLAFDVTGLAYFFGFILTLFIPIFASGFYGLLLIPVGLAVGVGLLILLILAKTKSRLLSQKPPAA